MSEHLILDIDARDPGADESANGLGNDGRIAKTVLAVCHHRHLDGFNDTLGQGQIPLKPKGRLRGAAGRQGEAVARALIGVIIRTTRSCVSISRSSLALSGTPFAEYEGETRKDTLVDTLGKANTG